MSSDVYGATVILMAVASPVAIRVSRHRVQLTTYASLGFTQPFRQTIFRSAGCRFDSHPAHQLFLTNSTILSNQAVGSGDDAFRRSHYLHR
jgi:hypothetical protein